MEVLCKDLHSFFFYRYQQYRIRHRRSSFVLRTLKKADLPV